MMLIETNSLVNYKSRDSIPFKCEYCSNVFYCPKNRVMSMLKGSVRNKLKYCSKKCKGLSMITSVEVECFHCKSKVDKKLCDLKKRRSHFCSQTCAAIYNNAHKKSGVNRSKLEKWLETKLTQLFPKLEIHYNKTNAINAELDIFFPSLKLAFELNGIFHYEPIFGNEKLQSTQNNDKRKFQACLEKQIELCIIDVSKEKYFKEHISKKYLDIITNIVESKLLNS